MTTLLLTGIGGFIGSHVLDHVLATTNWEIVGVDSFRHKGRSGRITSSALYQAQPERVHVITHDLRAPIDPRLAAEIGHADFIIHLASESHVDRSIRDPVPFIENNVAVTLTMLEFARTFRPKAFVQISTDEVYGPAAPGHEHTEWSTILPSNPYSASKAAQEAIAIAYWRTYGVPLILTNTMNNFGERQDVEKYLPHIISLVLRGGRVAVHGTPDNIGSRCWLHARNHADALVWILRNRPPSLYPTASRPDRYNIVGDTRLDNLAFAQLVATHLAVPLLWAFAPNPASRPGHDLHYGLDGSKLNTFGWRPPVPFGASLAHTIRWYVEHPTWLTQ